MSDLIKIGIDDEALRELEKDTLKPLGQTVKVVIDSKEYDKFVDKIAQGLNLNLNINSGGNSSSAGSGGAHNLSLYTNQAEVTGNALANGNIRRTVAGKTLMGELGEEMIVDPRTGKWYTVGTNGAEFVDLPQNSFVFNHLQTKDLLEHRFVASRAAAFIGGSSMVTGNAMLTGYMPIIGATASTISGGYTSNIHSSTDSLEDVDWIEVAIERISTAIEKLKNIASSAYRSIKDRLGASADAITAVNEQISIQQRAYERYMHEADSINISDNLKSLVQSGSIDIVEYDEGTQKLIETYQEFYEKALDCKTAVDDLHESLSDICKERFDMIQYDYNNQLDIMNHSVTTFENGIDLMEAQGYIANTSFYDAMRGVESNKYSLLLEEKASLEKSLSEGIASGQIEIGSEEFYAMQIEINGVTEALQESQIAMADYDKTIRETDWGHFDYLQERISQLTTESEFLIDLLSNSDLHDEAGNLTDAGLATMGLHGQNYNVYMEQADDYAQQILALNKEIADDPHNTELIARREELLGLQQDSILAADGEKQAIIDLVKDGIDLELESMQNLIDKYKDALHSAKDLYDYQNKIEDHTDEISSLKKQLSAYEGDLSEEGRAKVQKLTVDLADAEEALEETEYEKYISDQEKLLDDLYIDYEQVLNERLDDVNGLINDAISAINTGAEGINETLTTAANGVGYDLSESMKSIWNGSSDSASSVISKYGDSNDNGISKVQEIISSIAANVDAMIQESEKLAEKDVTSHNANGAGMTTAPDANSAIDVLAQKGIINSPDYWRNNIDEMDYLDLLLVKLAANTQAEPTENFTDVEAAINYLGQNGVIDTPGYWLNNYAKLPWLEKLLITAANHTIPKYKRGGLADFTGIAQMDGTPTNPELVLDAEDTEHFLALRDALDDLMHKELTYGSGSHSYLNSISHASGLTDINRLVMNVTPNNEASGNQIGEINITIPIDHVQDYNDFVNQLRGDKKFEQFISSITTNRYLGGSELVKNKYKW